MGKKCPITIGEYEFGTKLEAKAAVQKVLNRHQLRDRLTGDEDIFIRDLIALHPATEDKIGCGISHIEIRTDPNYGTTRCFYIVRTDGSDTDVSYIKCIDGEKLRQLLRPALRNAILAQVLHFKQVQFATSFQRCPYTDELLNFDTCHVDHLPPMTFETLVTEWLKLNGLTEADVQITEREDNASTRFMTDVGQVASWTSYHQQYAQLRILSQRGNLSNSKIEAGMRAREDQRRG